MSDFWSSVVIELSFDCKHWRAMDSAANVPDEVLRAWRHYFTQAGKADPAIYGKRKLRYSSTEVYLRVRNRQAD